MGVICRGHNLPWLMEAQALLEENEIPVLLQEPSMFYGSFGGGWVLTVPNEDHERALKLLRDAGLDFTSTDSSDGI